MELTDKQREILGGAANARQPIPREMAYIALLNDYGGLLSKAEHERIVILIQERFPAYGASIETFGIL